MNYGQCIEEIRDLGFSDDEEMEEFGTVVPNAVTRACEELSRQFPYYAKLEIEVTDEDEKYLYIDMTDQEGFIELKDTPVMFRRGGAEYFTRFTDYDIEMGSTIVINTEDNKGHFRFYYAKQPTRMTLETEDDFEFEIPLKAHVLIPLLSAYYVWLEDDAAKASQYYNLYEQKMETVKSQAEKPRGRILRGGI